METQTTVSSSCPVAPPPPNEGLTKPAVRRVRRAASRGRRGQRQKRRGQGEKRRGQRDKRRGQRGRRSEEEEDERERREGVTVKRCWGGGRRRWDKRHYCVFCRRPQVKMARHLLQKHRDQQEVAQASSLPTGSKQRHLLLEQLRCRGNYLHNIEVIRQGRGEIVPCRQPSEEVDARNYLPCPLCLGFFLRADLWKHQASCRRKMTSDPAGHTTSDPTGHMTSDPAGHTTSDPTGHMTSDPAGHTTSDLPGHTTSDPMGDTTSDPTRDTISDPAGHTTSDPTRDTTSDPAGHTISEPVGHMTSDPAGDTTSDPLRDSPTANCTVVSDPGTKRPLTSDPESGQTVTSDPVGDRPRKRCRVQAAASRLLPVSSGASESCSEVLHRMNQDAVSHQVKSDWLICKYGNRLMSSEEGGQMKYDYVSKKLRELGRFLLAAKSLDSNVWSLQDVLAPPRLRLALAAARKASGYRSSRLPLAVKTALKTVCEIAIGESLQDGDWEAAAKTTDFYELLGREWDALSPTPDPDTDAMAGGAGLKKQTQQRGSEVKCKGGGVEQPDPRPAESPDPDLRPQDVRPEISERQTPPGFRMLTHVNTPAPSRKVRRRPWSSAEKEAVWRQLGVHVLVQSVPGKEVCQRCLDLEPALRGRHWKDVKNHVHNQIQSQKKQQFHAQMDHQENQDHQIQSQKKQQCHTQMNHEDQIQKKQQFHSQMDHQNQIQINNQKKQQYLVQMNHQDQVHIQKKQPYQAEMDRDHQDQGLLGGTALARDTPIPPSYIAGGPHRASGQMLLEQNPISSYPAPHRAPGPPMDGPLSRAAWTDGPLTGNYPISRQLTMNPHQDTPPGAPPTPHSGHTQF
ncbi:uncharacterized protein LOC115376631 isoform X2 [Myripristis murdjan]|uniref:uncharacterized protein LOC115376631 isoform X2 n=1 Tax=Myripristis murdjan TaxID=586833 RepID=UPI00117613B8|nr:uncharacterized protein LOC115376631 isoform X2 [Myripristis murdjan]